MIAVVPLLHEIIPHGWTRLGLIAPDAAITSYFAEIPESEALYRERLWQFMEDPSALCSLWVPMVQNVAISWTLHRQIGANYLETGYFREVESVFDSCWVLDTMIGDGGRTIGFIHLTRPRSARPFTSAEVQRLDRLRPWIAHALRRPVAQEACQEDEALTSTSGRIIRSGQLIATADARLIHQTDSVEFLLRILSGGPAVSMRNVPMPARDELPAPILKLLHRIIGAANGASNMPPRAQISTAYGIVTLEAQWLLPTGVLPEDAARDPKCCLISVMIELREYAIAHAARLLRESGATPAQTRVGILLALGKSKPMIADELGIKISSVEDHAKKLYQTLDVHNAAALAKTVWTDQKPQRVRQIFRASDSRTRKNPPISAVSPKTPSGWLD
jgi:DNA-binding CsgD family transcriptional regulator